MCGINGIVTFNNQPKSIVKKIVQMNDFIFHRGPDDSGEYFHNDTNYSIGMGMRRLSIIDIKSGHQPMFSEDNQIVICFNGEIYNFLDLKQNLIRKGVSFKTNSDTEVILRLYENEGLTFFHKLDGMFAFSIHDKIKKRLILVRDYFGEKPLYFYANDELFAWSSELKSLKNAHLIPETISCFSLNLFFKLSYIPAPHTIYENVFKLLPGHYLDFNLNDKSYKIKSFVKKNNFDFENNISFDEARLKTKDLVFSSVNSRTISDVPLGSFLSGGVDSSIVSYCLSKVSKKTIDTFSIGFKNKKFDESDKAREVAQLIKSNHHEFILQEDDLLGLINSIIQNFDEPFGDSSALPSFYVAKKAKDYVKVVLTGDGGDEVFGGYNKYLMTKINQKYTNTVPVKVHNYLSKSLKSIFKDKDDVRGLKFQINKLINSISYSGDHYWNIISLGFKEEEREYLLNKYIPGDELILNYKDLLQMNTIKNLNDMREVDRFLSLEGDLLVKVDRTSMMNSLECRSPFLNRELWNFTRTLPEKYLINGSEKKWLLRKSFENDFPKHFLDKKKHGFGIPIGDWLRTHLFKSLEQLSEKELITSQGIFKFDYLKNMINRHMKREKDFTFQLWSFYCFQVWYFNTQDK